MVGDGDGDSDEDGDSWPLGSIWGEKWEGLKFKMRAGLEVLYVLMLKSESGNRKKNDKNEIDLLALIIISALISTY